MFVFISQIVNLLISPFFILIFSCFLPFLTLLKFRKRWLEVLLLGAPLWALIFLASPLGSGLTYLLEKQSAPLSRKDFEESVSQLSDRPVAIVVLAGDVITYKTDHEHFKTATNFPRFLTPFIWSKAYPNVHFIVSCGLLDGVEQDTLNEGPSMEKFALEMGLESSRIHVTRCTRNSFEEALAAQEILKVLNPRLTYVSTSAIHMPRVMGIYSKLGLGPQAFPAQYYTIPFHYEFLSFGPHNSALLRQSIHELIGQIAYKLTGKVP